MSFIKKILKASGDINSSIAADGIIGDAEKYFLDTGSYSLNALISGSIYKGPPSNKITAIAGEEATGKSLYVLSTAKEFLDAYPEAIVVLFETERSTDDEAMTRLEMDTSRIIYQQPETIEKFRTAASKILTEYEKTPEDERPKMLFILDSLGNLPSNKEVQDVEDGKDVRDMTKAQLIKATFRVLTLKLGRLNVPMLIVGHVYANIAAMYGGNTVSGGSGLLYAASNIIGLTKKKFKDSQKKQIGITSTAKVIKSRTVFPDKKLETRIMFGTGLDRYAGLFELAIEAGIFKKDGLKIKYKDDILAKDGKEFDRKKGEIFTKEILDDIDDWCQNNLTLSSHK